MNTVPEVQFDAEQAERIFPRPVLKQAVLIPIPNAEGGDELPSYIRPEWGGLQVFFGDYYGIVHNGEVVYGSAKDQWELMHTQVEPDFWVKTAVPTAYQATEPCRIVTLIPSEFGGFREANYVLKTGDWVVRQPGGEVQHVKAEKFGDIYFSHEEAAELGLTELSNEAFAEWARTKVQARVGTRS